VYSKPLNTFCGTH